MVVLIGGVSKGGDAAPVVAALQQAQAHVLTIGRSAAWWHEQCRLAGVASTHVDTVDTIAAAFSNLPADTAGVLLAPACASHDQYANYAARGEDFVQRGQVWLQAH